MKHKLNIADAITLSRIVFAVLVLFCAAFSMRFYAFYLLGGFTDMMDGWAAMILNSILKKIISMNLRISSESVMSNMFTRSRNIRGDSGWFASMTQTGILLKWAKI